MKIKIMGAAGGEVTGSTYIVQTEHARLLVDCGMFQGGKRTEALNRPPTGPKQKLDTVLVTHGHLDHTGRLPLLAQKGYQGPIFATPATIDMAALILRDAARIQEGDVERRNRKLERAREAPVKPLYTSQDVETIMGRFMAVPYRQSVPVAPGVQALFADAGHMVGSSSIQLVVDEGGKQKRVVFSGDLGPMGLPILRDFKPFHTADLVFLESTYGDRDHRPFRATAEEFIRVVKEAHDRKGKILIPTFAVGRAQMLTVLLSWAFRHKHLRPFPLFLDSPMAIEATEIYVKYFRKSPELYQERLLEHSRRKPIREDLKTLTNTLTPSESRAINDCVGPCLIMAGAGMCNAGRILHHLKANLWKPDTHLVFVGYQAHGSLGRMLIEGAKLVRIHGEKIAVRARVHTMGGFSAHAGQRDILTWFEAIQASKPRLMLIHGENRQREELAKSIRRKYGIQAALPQMGDVIEV